MSSCCCWCGCDCLPLNSAGVCTYCDEMGYCYKYHCNKDLVEDEEEESDD